MGLAKQGGPLLEKLGIENLSELIIDADKNWQVKGISNIRELADTIPVPIDLERTTETQAEWAAGTLIDVQAIADALILDSAAVEQEDTFDTANLTGSSYAVVYNRMEFKVSGTLTKVKVKTRVAGDYTLRVKSDDGVTTHQTHTIVGAAADAWITFVIIAIAVSIGDKYRMEVTRPNGTAYAQAILYDGVLWKNNKAGFGAGEFDWTNAMGFFLDIPTYDLTGTRTAPPLDLSTITDVNTSIAEWVPTTPAGTTIVISFAVNNDPFAPPAPGDYVVAVNGDPIPGIVPGADLTGQWLWAKMELATIDNSVTPRLEDMREYILSRETTPVIGPMNRGDMLSHDNIRIVILRPGSPGLILTSAGPGNPLTWGHP